jgi:hypothetical protein
MKNVIQEITSTTSPQDVMINNLFDRVHDIENKLAWLIEYLWLETYFTDMVFEAPKIMFKPKKNKTKSLWKKKKENSPSKKK